MKKRLTHNEMVQLVENWPTHTREEIETAIITHCKEHKPLQDEYRMRPEIVVKTCQECGRDYKKIEYVPLWPSAIGNCDCGGVLVEDKINDGKRYEYRCVLCRKQWNGPMDRGSVNIPGGRGRGQR